MYICISFRSCPPCTLRGINFENHGEYLFMATAKEWKERGAGRALEVSITNKAPYPSCQISTKALLNCICPVFTNNLSRSDQFLVTNIHTSVCLCVYSNAQKRLPGA